MRAAHQRERDIVDRYPGGGASFGAAVMRMAVDDGRHRMAIQRLFKTAAPEEREDLDRFILDGRPDRGVVEHGDPAVGA